jgi:hypothetical protein
MIAAPHLYLSRSFAPNVSFVTDAWVVGVLVTLASATVRSAGPRRDAERRRKRSYLVGVELHRLVHPHWRREHLFRRRGLK